MNHGRDKKVDDRDRQLEELKRRIAAIEQEKNEGANSGPLTPNVSTYNSAVGNSNTESAFLTPRLNSTDLIDLRTPSPQKARAVEEQEKPVIDTSAGVQD